MGLPGKSNAPPKGGRETKLCEAALDIQTPWRESAVDWDTEAQTLTIRIAFGPESRFLGAGIAGAPPVHDTVEKRYRRLNFFPPQPPWRRLTHAEFKRARIASGLVR